MKKSIFVIATLFVSLFVKANQVTQALQKPHIGDFMFCRGETDPAQLTYLLTLDGEVYISNSKEKNPAKIQDFSIFTNFKLMKPDSNEMYVYTIDQNKHKADFVAQFQSQSMFLVLTYQDNDNYQSAGYLIKDGSTIDVTCFDVTQFLEKAVE